MSNRWLGMTWMLILCASLGLVAFGQEAAMPKPGAEHEALGFFAGKWNFEGEAKESPMGPAGEISFSESCEWFEGNFALVCRSEGTTPMGPTKAIGVMSYDADQQAYTYYGVESGMPPFMATGHREGKTWKYKTESKMGKTRVTITETSPTSYSFEMEFSADGSTWSTVVTGKSTKATT